MGVILRRIVAITALLVMPTIAMAQAEAGIPSTRQFDLVSAINRATYRIQVFVPRGAPPPGGFPALYVLDGNALFGTFAEAMRNRAMANELTPAVVVGIAGGPGADRTVDFTSADMSATEKTLIKDLGPDPRFGGAEAFLRVIREEVQPKVQALVPVDPARGALFGWSLGGLFVTHAMFTHPEAFRTWLALSPSLWRSDRAVFGEIPGFRARIAKAGIVPRYFIGVGGREEVAPPGMRLDGMTTEELAAELRYCRMVGNAKDLVDALQPASRRGELTLASRVFDGDSHNSVPWSAVNTVLDVAFAMDQPGDQPPPKAR